MPQVKYKRHLNNKIAIVIENVECEPNEPIEINNVNEVTLHDNLVEKYLQSILKPLDMMQALFVCARYKIQDNIISVNTRFYSVMSVCASVFLMALNYVLFFMSSNRTEVEDFDYFVLNIYDLILFFFGGLLNSITNIEQRLNNVLFVLKIQNVHKIHKDNSNSFKCFIITNWLCVIAINCFHFFWILLYLSTFYEVGLANIMASYACIRFDMNIIYATRSITLVYKALKSWIEELRSTGFVDNAEDEPYLDYMFQTYGDIIQVFEILEKTFHRLVLFYIVHTCSNTLFDIWIRADLRSLAPDHGDFQYAFLTFLSLTWVFKNLALLSSLSIQCEKFYSGMTQVQGTCIQIITSERCSETRKRFCKNIQRVQNTTSKKMEVCGLFTIDAEMPVHVLGLITTYTIVLLQFEFL